MKPFRMIIVSPDTAIIEHFLDAYIDTTVLESVNRYYALAEQVKKMFDSADFRNGHLSKNELAKGREDSKAAFNIAKQFKDNIGKFQYYQAIPIHAAVVFDIYFNLLFPNSTVQITDKTGLSNKELKRIADSLQADYVIGYRDIHTENKTGLISMKMRTILFARKEGKIILSAETTGDGINYGDIWGCSNPLSCLLVTTLKPSIEMVAELLAKRQHD